MEIMRHADELARFALWASAVAIAVVLVLVKLKIIG